MRTSVRSFAAAALVVAAALAITACGDTGKAINDAMNINTEELQGAGQGISAAAAECSEASGQVSELMIALNKAVVAKDLAAAQALVPQLQVVADQLHQAEKDGIAAAQGLGSLPGGAGSQATEGTEMGFKACGNTGDQMQGLADAVSGASEEDLEGGKLQKQIDKVQQEAMDALSELGNG